MIDTSDLSSVQSSPPSICACLSPAAPDPDMTTRLHGGPRVGIEPLAAALALWGQTHPMLTAQRKSRTARNCAMRRFLRRPLAAGRSAAATLFVFQCRTCNLTLKFEQAHSLPSNLPASEFISRRPASHPRDIQTLVDRVRSCGCERQGLLGIATAIKSLPAASHPDR